MDTPFKHCPKCKRDLPATLDFFYRDAKKKRGLNYVCKDCVKAAVKIWEAAHPETTAARHRRWRDAHKAERTAYQRQYRAKRKGSGADEEE